jgi:hypothetical protein
MRRQRRWLGSLSIPVRTIYSQIDPNSRLVQHAPKTRTTRHAQTHSHAYALPLSSFGDSTWHFPTHCLAHNSLMSTHARPTHWLAHNSLTHNSLVPQCDTVVAFCLFVPVNCVQVQGRRYVQDRRAIRVARVLTFPRRWTHSCRIVPHGSSHHHTAAAIARELCRHSRHG